MERVKNPNVKKRRIVIAASMVFGFVILGVVTFGLLFRATESKPDINGIPFSQWIQMGAGATDRTSGVPPGKVMPYLIGALNGRDSAINRFATAIWSKLPNSVRNRTWKYRPSDPRTVRGNALSILHSLGPAAEDAVPDLIQIIREPKYADIRGTALTVLGNIGRNSSEALEVKIAALKDKDYVSRFSAALALREFASKSDAAVPLLAETIRQEKAGQPFNALLALETYGPKAAPAVPALVEALKDPQLRQNTVTALSKIGPAAAPAVPLLVDLLRNPETRSFNAGILETLMNIGPAAAPAIPTLEPLLNDPDAGLRVLSSTTIACLQAMPEKAVPTLVRELANTDYVGQEPAWILRYSPSRSIGFVGFNHRETAAWLLGKIGAPAKDAIPTLTAVAQGSSGMLPVLAVRAIWRIEANPDACLPGLNSVLVGNDEIAQVFAAQVLTEMGPKAKPAVPALVQCLRRVSWRHYSEILDALRAIDPGATEKAFRD
jgi:HEAT repeat protein